MKNKKHIIFFILINAFLLFTFILMSFTWDGKYTGQKVLSNFFFNLPSWLLMGAFDYLMIKFSSNKIRWKNETLRIIADLIVTNLFIILMYLIVHYFILSTDGNHIIRYVIPIFVWNSIIVFLIEIFMNYQKKIDVEKKLAIAEKEKIQYQYETLKAQVNPHFLFNSLNVLSSLAYQDAEKANLFTKKLSGVYRYLLLTNEYPTVTIKEELSFLESYLYLEKIRFENTFSIEITKENDRLLNKYVIPVSLQLLVDNALKHNKTTKEEPLSIQIDISDNGITVFNNLQLRSSVDKGGVGLRNLQKQYALYDKHITVSQTDTQFIVKMPYI